MKFSSIFKFFFTLIAALFLFYLLLPNPTFPEPPPDALQSQEPADTESGLRKAYFTNLTREEVMAWYMAQMDTPLFFGISLPVTRFNYPPENAQTIIRDQTRSIFLEELVHPFRDGIYINGFEPKLEKDAIFIEGKNWRQKITVRFVPSSLISRVVVFILTGISFIALYLGWNKTIKDIKNLKFKL